MFVEKIKFSKKNENSNLIHLKFGTKSTFIPSFNHLVTVLQEHYFILECQDSLIFKDLCSLGNSKRILYCLYQ
jgi:hypothetical protein